MSQIKQHGNENKAVRVSKLGKLGKDWLKSIFHG